MSMLHRIALVLLCALTSVLAGCASPVAYEEEQPAVAMADKAQGSYERDTGVQSMHFALKSQTRLPQHTLPASQTPAAATQQNLMQRAHEVVEQIYEFPKMMVSTILDRGFDLVGTPYRAGGNSEKTGFDCSGFVGFLFREEAGIDLPRSTREMIELDAPTVARRDLQPGDVLFFNNQGRGRVSHTGIYIGNDQFIHSSSRRSGGVRVDSLEDRYWNNSYMQAKRVLAGEPDA